MKNQKGITLVALVITIIVLLILAGVSISLVVGQNGILEKAKSAVQANEKAVAEQEIKFAIADAQTAYYSAYAINPNVSRGEFFGASSYYINNCTSADKDGIILKKASGVNDTSNSGEITITYKTKSGVFYRFVFDIANPDEFKSISGPTNS